LLNLLEFLAKNSSKFNKFLHSELNQIIHIIVQDQDGQNNNTIRFILSMNTYRTRAEVKLS